MTNEDIKELYKSGEWVCISINLEHKYRGWTINKQPAYSPTYEYKLIHKKHEHILDAWLDGCEVYFYDTERKEYLYDDQFIFLYDNNYPKDKQYEAVPKSLENCYCEASELHFKELTKNYLWDRPTDIGDEKKGSYTKYTNLIIEEECEVLNASYPEWESLSGHKKIQYNEQLNNWTYCPYSQELKQCTQCNDGIPNNNVELDTNNSSNKINNFSDYGFTADFEGEIIKEVTELKGEINYLGYVVGSNKTHYPCLWTQEGRMWKTSICESDRKQYNLTPIKPEPQYPIFKKSTTSGAIVKFTSKNKGTLVLGESGGNYLGETHSVWIDPMDTSSWADVPYNSERELYHGQPCYNITNTDRTIFIYETNVEYEGFDTIEPISLETLATMSFIWDMYKDIV